MKIRKRILLGLCAGLLLTGCRGAGDATEPPKAVENTEVSTNTEMSTGTDETNSPEGSGTENNGTESSGTESSGPSSETQTEELSEEDAYWTGRLEEFADSKYDLTRALTDPALRDYCQDYFRLGVGINGSTLENQTLNMPEYMAVVEKHFNSVTMTNLMKSCYILDQSGSRESLANGDGSPVLNFASIDPTLQWCMDHGMQMRGHTLVWHAQAPEWFFREGYSEDGDYVDKDTMLFRMESYIAQMLTHVQDNYPGVIYCWDVVNEAVDPDKGDLNSYFRCRTESDAGTNPWYATIGEDYVEMAFTYARKYADPEVKLYYNDFNTYMLQKRTSIMALCENLKEKGLIDGIGMQGYWGTDYPKLIDIETAIRMYATLDLELQITELSVDLSEENEETFEKQAKTYGNIFITLHNLDSEAGGPANITAVTLFGLIDHYREGDKTNSRLWDSRFQPKPAYERVASILKMCYK